MTGAVQAAAIRRRGDVFGSQRCDCGPQLREAVERITNNRDKCAQLARLGITIAKQVPTALHLNEKPRGC